MSDDYGSGRIRTMLLPNGQFLIVIDRAGYIRDSEARWGEWVGLREDLLSRLGRECAGVLRYAQQVDLPEEQDVHLRDDAQVVPGGAGGANDHIGAGREQDRAVDVQGLRGGGGDEVAVSGIDLRKPGIRTDQ